MSDGSRSRLEITGSLNLQLATLVLTTAKEGTIYAATEARSMVAGAIALGLYCQLVSWLIMRFRWHSLAVTTFSNLLWFAIAFGSWIVFLK